VDYFSIIRCISVNYELDPKDISVIVDFHRDCIGLVFIRKQEYFLSYKLFLQRAVDESAELVKLVLKDLRRIIFGHGLGKGVEDIHRFFILDHVSRKDFIDAFSDAVGVPVEGIQPFRKMVLSAEVSESNELALLPERFVTSIGAVLKKFPSLVK
jgi:hypothetical protein